MAHAGLDEFDQRRALGASSSAKKQALPRSSGGRSARQRARASGQRGAKAQPWPRSCAPGAAPGIAAKRSPRRVRAGSAASSAAV
jgi:hypothetical protein